MASDAAHVFKVVVTGPFSAGKTTFIETVVQREFVTMAAATTSDGETGVKQSTTVGMDFGVLTVPDEGGDIELRIYGTPGQERFSFMWEVLAEGSDGYVLVVDGETPATWVAARAHQAVMDRVGIPGVIAVNRGDEAVVAEAGEYFADVRLPVVGCDARDADDVLRVLVCALVEMLERIDQRDGPAPPDDLADPYGDDADLAEAYVIDPQPVMAGEAVATHAVAWADAWDDVWGADGTEPLSDPRSRA